MTTIRLSDLNDNSKSMLREIAKQLSDRFYEELNLDKLTDLPIDKSQELEKIIEQVALTFHDGRDDILDKIMFASKDDQKRLRSVEEMKQLRLGFAQRFNMDLFDSFDEPDVNKLFLARLMYTNKHDEIENYVDYSSADFEAIANAFMNGYTKEEIDKKIEDNSLFEENTVGLGQLIDEYGAIGDDTDFELVDDFDSFIK